jgi:hypothetical protein
VTNVTCCLQPAFGRTPLDPIISNFDFGYTAHSADGGLTLVVQSSDGLLKFSAQDWSLFSLIVDNFRNAPRSIVFNFGNFEQMYN